MKKTFLLLFFLITVSVNANSDNVEYIYDEKNSEILAKDKSGHGKLPFKREENGNSSAWFDFFNKKPAIWFDNNSLDSYSAKATLFYKKGKFYLDCIYAEAMSKKNGLSLNKAICGISKEVSDDYTDYVRNEISSWFDELNKYDSRALLSGFVQYLPVILYRKNNHFIYQNYNDVNNLVSSDYTILIKDGEKTFSFSGERVYTVYDKDGNFVKLEQAIFKNSSILMKEIKHSDMEITGNYKYPPFSIKGEKSYLYNDKYEKTKRYIIHNDEISLLFFDQDSKWCKIEYLTPKNKAISGNILCSDLKFNKYP